MLYSQISKECDRLWLVDRLLEKINFKSSKILFSATQSSFDNKNFHRCCDGKNHLVLIAKTTKGVLFGGYSQ